MQGTFIWHPELMPHQKIRPLYFSRIFGYYFNGHPQK